MKELRSKANTMLLMLLMFTFSVVAAQAVENAPAGNGDVFPLISANAHLNDVGKIAVDLAFTGDAVGNQYNAIIWQNCSDTIDYLGGNLVTLQTFIPPAPLKVGDNARLAFVYELPPPSNANTCQIQVRLNETNSFWTNIVRLDIDK